MLSSGETIISLINWICCGEYCPGDSRLALLLGHTADSRSAWCLPGFPDPFQQSWLPASQSPACSVASDSPFPCAGFCWIPQGFYMLLTPSHLKCLCMMALSSSLSYCPINLVSSAALKRVPSNLSSRSLIKVLNRTGLRRYHYSTPFVINIQVEHNPLMNTLRDRPYNPLVFHLPRP